MGRQDFETETLLAVGGFPDPGKLPFLTSSDGHFDRDEWDRHGRLVPVAIQAGALRENPSSGPDGVGVQEDIAYTLEARSEVQAVAFDCKASGRNGFGIGATAPTLRAMGHSGSHSNAGGQVAIAIGGRARGDDGRGYDRPEHLGVDVASTLDGVKVDRVLGPFHMAVRRLTPVECERLQGLPDNFTAVMHNGKPAADGPRYKAIGNGMALPVLQWIGERIQAVEELCAQ